jgi:hypothetical protein
MTKIKFMLFPLKHDSNDNKFNVYKDIPGKSSSADYEYETPVTIIDLSKKTETFIK